MLHDKYINTKYSYIQRGMYNVIKDEKLRY